MPIRRLSVAIVLLAGLSLLLYGCAGANLVGLAPTTLPGASAAGQIQAQRFDEGAYVLTTSIFGANVALYQGSSGTPTKQYQLDSADLVLTGLTGFSTSLSYIVSPSTDQMKRVDAANDPERELALVIADITGSRTGSTGQRAFAPWTVMTPVWLFLPGVNTDWTLTYANWGDTLCAAQYNTTGQPTPSNWDLWIGSTLMKVSQACAQILWNPGLLPGVRRG